MKFVAKLFYSIILLLVAGCDIGDGKLTIVNNTDDTLFYSFSYDNDSILSYPIGQIDGKENYQDSKIILPQSEIREPVMAKWEYFINERCKDSTLRIFFFTRDLIKTISKDSIQKYQVYSKREKLKVKDLELLKWRVTYP